MVINKSYECNNDNIKIRSSKNIKTPNLNKRQICGSYNNIGQINEQNDELNGYNSPWTTIETNKSCHFFNEQNKNYSSSTNIDNVQNPLLSKEDQTDYLKKIIYENKLYLEYDFSEKSNFYSKFTADDLSWLLNCTKNEVNRMNGLIHLFNLFIKYGNMWVKSNQSKQNIQDTKDNNYCTKIPPSEIYLPSQILNNLKNLQPLKYNAKYKPYINQKVMDTKKNRKNNNQRSEQQLLDLYKDEKNLSTKNTLSPYPKKTFENFNNDISNYSSQRNTYDDYFLKSSILGQTLKKLYKKENTKINRTIDLQKLDMSINNNNQSIKDYSQNKNTLNIKNYITGQKNHLKQSVRSKIKRPSLPLLKKSCDNLIYNHIPPDSSSQNSQDKKNDRFLNFNRNYWRHNNDNSYNCVSNVISEKKSQYDKESQALQPQFDIEEEIDKWRPVYHHNHYHINHNYKNDSNLTIFKI